MVRLPKWSHGCWFLSLVFFLLGVTVTSFVGNSIQDKSGWFEVGGKKTKNQPKTLIDQQAFPTPKPLPTGKQTYNFSHGDKVVGPKPTQAIIDPIDPISGSQQSLTIILKDQLPLTSAQAIIKTDNQRLTLDLKLVSNSTTGEVWQVTWPVNDSYLNTYEIELSLKDTQNTFIGGLSFR
jgi:hypothetical protein